MWLSPRPAQSTSAPASARHGTVTATSTVTPGAEYNLGNGVYAQKFSNRKTIYWTNANGAHWVVTNGGLDYKFRSNVARYRGLATNEEERFQTVAVSFANGEGAYWTESTGTHTLNERGSIYWAWRNSGAQGAPTTDEENLGGGIVKQNSRVAAPSSGAKRPAPTV